MNGTLQAYTAALILVILYNLEPIHFRVNRLAVRASEGGWDWLLNQWCKAMRHAADPRYDYIPRHLT